MPMNRATLELFAALDRSSPDPAAQPARGRDLRRDHRRRRAAGHAACPPRACSPRRCTSRAGVVSEAYAQIAAEGWIEIRRGSAPVVRTAAAAPAAHVALGVPAGPGQLTDPGFGCGSGGLAGPGRRGSAWRPRRPGVPASAGGRSMPGGRAVSGARRAASRPHRDRARPLRSSRGARVVGGAAADARGHARRRARLRRPARRRASCGPSSPPTSCACAGVARRPIVVAHAAATRRASGSRAGRWPRAARASVAVEDPSLDDARATIRSAGLRGRRPAGRRPRPRARALDADARPRHPGASVSKRGGDGARAEEGAPGMGRASRDRGRLRRRDHYDRAPIGDATRLAPDRVVYLGTATQDALPRAPARLAGPPARSRSTRRAASAGRRLGAPRRSSGLARLLAPGE